VRPWALAVPLLVLLIALPLLRPLRHPGHASEDELLRLATVRAIVEHGTLCIDQTAPPDAGSVVRSGGRIYAEHAPMMAVLLSPPAWVMHGIGLSFDENQLLVSYLLTLIGVTLPVAAAGGLIYRMGRLFELRRAWRTALAATCVLGTGLLSYSVVLNPHAPAAVLVLCSAACLIHVASLKLASRTFGWLFLAGFSAALAATLDSAASIFMLLFMFVIAAIRFPIGVRALGIVLYILGAAAPVLAHDLINRRITGDIFPAALHEEFARGRALEAPTLAYEELGEESVGSAVGAYASWLVTALIGAHGLFSHFPITLIGIAGVGAVMHRHWPSSTKTLAAATLAAAATVVVLYCTWRVDWSRAMFGARWFIVFLPMLVFWCGAWARRGHSPAAWGFAGSLLAFSVFVTLVGATNPTPPGGFDQYTPVAAIREMLHLQAMGDPSVRLPP
jgi:hypothetical protein